MISIRSAIFGYRWRAKKQGLLGAALTSVVSVSALAAHLASAAVLTLDGDAWRLATDPRNVGREEKWFAAPRTNAVPTRVPWIIQDAFPGYHGVAWYWRELDVPQNPYAGGRCLLRFWAVDYLAEVWLNGVRVGGHEGGETPFTLDVTDTIHPGAKNLLAVRVLNPTHERIDGVVLVEWAERLGPLLPRQRLTVSLSVEGEGRRAILEGDSRFGEI